MARGPLRGVRADPQPAMVRAIAAAAAKMTSFFIVRLPSIGLTCGTSPEIPSSVYYSTIFFIIKAYQAEIDKKNHDFSGTSSTRTAMFRQEGQNSALPLMTLILRSERMSVKVPVKSRSSRSLQTHSLSGKKQKSICLPFELPDLTEMNLSVCIRNTGWTPEEKANFSIIL